VLVTIVILPSMKPLTNLPNRQIHLDFHTGPAIPDVGADFDPDVFGDMLVDAHVNSVTLFAKCHHGHLYYNTKRPERHPSLKPGLDLLGEQLEACRKRGIRAPIYISMQCDEYAANLRPDWICLNPDGTRVGRKPLANDAFQWQILDMSSPYADFLAEQIEEVVRLYKPVDEIFLDMCWDQPSVSNWAKAGMLRAGLDPLIEADRTQYARQVVHGYMDRYNKLIARINGSAAPVWYNSRPKINLPEEVKYLQHIEIEALPTGGWGYTYFPLNVRFARTFGLPCIGMTARFHKSWSDFGGIKPHAALKYECAQMLAHGTGCSVGDQLHPRGTFDKAAMKLIGDVYAHVQACEPFCIDAKPVTEIAVIRNLQGEYHPKPGSAVEGVVRLLQQTFHQFDFVAPQADLANYRLAIVPDDMPLTPDLLKRLSAFVKRGGKVILTGAATIAAAGKLAKPWTGVATSQPPKNQVVFLSYNADVATAQDTEQVLYEPTNKLTPAAGASGFGRIVEPYFDRTWEHFSGHNQTAARYPTRTFAAVVGKHGAAFGFDLFRQYATHGNQHLRALLSAVLGELLPDPLICSSAPTHTEISVTRQSKPNRTIVHVLSYAPQRRTPTLDLVEEPTPLVDAEICLRLPQKPAKATLQPAGKPFAFTYTDGYASFTLTSTAGHDMVVFEK